MKTSTLGFEAFSAHLADGLRLHPEDFTDDARLVEDLGLDSFDLVELLAMIEELGVRFPDEVTVSFDTVGDIYREYELRANRLEAHT